MAVHFAKLPELLTRGVLNGPFEPRLASVHPVTRKKTAIANGRAPAWLASARGNFLRLAGWKGMGLNHSSHPVASTGNIAPFLAAPSSTLRIG